ncbi:MAG: metallophosphoesterase [Myxococcota bacterium]|jgi:Icc protein|nr:metallophosphoesterase [Myxococcota bacterium]
MTPIRIAQVSDAHIGLQLPAQNRADSKAQFLAVLDCLSHRNLDLLIFSGDLAGEQGEDEAYLWLREAISVCTTPVVLMAGNHDEPERMRRLLEIPTARAPSDGLYFEQRIQDLRLLFLDSSSYRIPELQWDWLRSRVLDTPTLLFVHHPPLLCSCRFMDEQAPLKDAEVAWSKLCELEGIDAIFCGHYHTERSLRRDGRMVYLTPSTLFQIDPYSPDFQIAHTRPGFRMIEYGARGLHTWVEYLD